MVLVSQLFEIDTADPVTLAVTIAALIAVAALAGYIPARRATRVDPLLEWFSELPAKVQDKCYLRLERGDSSPPILCRQGGPA